MTHSESPNVGPHNEEKKGDIRNTYREYAPYLSLGFQLAAVVVVFFLLGAWIDNRYGVEPIGKLIGVSVGIVGGFIKFFKSVASLMTNEERDRASKKREN